MDAAFTPREAGLTGYDTPDTSLLLSMQQMLSPYFVADSGIDQTERSLVQYLYEPLYQRHVCNIDIIRNLANQTNGVVFFDLAGQDMEGYNKFIPYYLFPDSIYTVSVSHSSVRTKISVGSNPWAPQEPTYNLASICERYGGGGHARVGAISFETGELERARSVAADIVAELKY